MTGYEAVDLDDTLAKARAAAVQVLREPQAQDDRTSAFVEFPGGYVAEIHRLTAHCRWTGSYDQLRIDYAVDRHIGTALEAVHYDVGDTVRDAGGHDSSYLGVEFKYSW